MDRLSDEIYHALDVSIPMLRDIFDDEVSFAITDTKVFLKQYKCDALPLDTPPGMPIPDGGAAHEALNTGRTVIRTVPKNVYGIPFKSYAIPIFGESGKVQGLIVAAKSLDKRVELHSMSQQLSSALLEISNTITAISTGVNNLVEMNNGIGQKMSEARKMTKDTDDVIAFVRGVASQTNLLGLNAAIEAARSSDTGRGFNVVAQEIRKLSQSTSESIKKINDSLNGINGAIGSISDSIDESNGIFLDQAAALQEIVASIEELNSTAQILESLAEKY